MLNFVFFINLLILEPEPEEGKLQMTLRKLQNKLTYFKLLEPEEEVEEEEPEQEEEEAEEEEGKYILLRKN